MKHSSTLRRGLLLLAFLTGGHFMGRAQNGVGIGPTPPTPRPPSTL